MKVIKLIARGIGAVFGAILTLAGCVGLYLNGGETFEDMGANKVILEAVPAGDPLVSLVCIVLVVVGAISSLYLVGAFASETSQP